MFLWFGDVREISYFAALRLRLLSQLESRLKFIKAGDADAADWLLRVRRSGFPQVCSPGRIMVRQKR